MDTTKRSSFSFLVLCTCLLCMVVLCTGCPTWQFHPAVPNVPEEPVPVPDEPEAGMGKLMTLITGDGESLTKAVFALLMPTKCEDSVVDVEAIESLTLTLTQITLDRAACIYDIYGDEECPDEPHDGDLEEEGEEEAKNGASPNQVVVFEGEQDLNILDLTGVAQMITSADVPAGKYTKIRLEVSNPRLVLKAEPDVVYTDVTLTANGHLFIKKQFEVPEGERWLLMLDFGGVHLVRNGNGGFVLTPCLQADVGVGAVETVVAGLITGINHNENLFAITLDDDSEVVVDYASAEVYLPEDGDAPTGTESNLGLEERVEVRGVLSSDGVLTADVVALLPADPA